MRALKDFAQAYINDVIIESGSFSKYLYYLRRLFQLLIKHNISIAPKKIFLRYLNINLLSRYIDSLEIATVDNKLKAIIKLNYPVTLKDLEHYLDLIDYLRSLVYYYI